MKTRLHTFSRHLILRLLFVLCLFLFIGCTFRESSSSNVIIKITDVQVNNNVATVTYEDGYTTQIDLATNSLVYQELDDGTYGVGVFGFQYASYGSTAVGTAPINSFYALDDKKYEAYDLRLRPYILEMLTEATIEYGGTMAQWNAISKGSGWNSDLSCTVVCSDGSIDLT